MYTEREREIDREIEREVKFHAFKRLSYIKQNGWTDSLCCDALHPHPLPSLKECAPTLSE